MGGEGGGRLWEGEEEVSKRGFPQSLQQLLAHAQTLLFIHAVNRTVNSTDDRMKKGVGCAAQDQVTQCAEAIGPAPAAVGPRTTVVGPTAAGVGPMAFCALGTPRRLCQACAGNRLNGHIDDSNLEE